MPAADRLGIETRLHKALRIAAVVEKAEFLEPFDRRVNVRFAEVLLVQIRLHLGHRAVLQRQIFHCIVHRGHRPRRLLFHCRSPFHVFFTVYHTLLHLKSRAKNQIFRVLTRFYNSVTTLIQLDYNSDAIWTNLGDMLNAYEGSGGNPHEANDGRKDRSRRMRSQRTRWRAKRTR